MIRNLVDGVLYTHVHGHRGGTLCPRCFGRAASALGLVLVWVPFVWFERGVTEKSPDIKDRINGSAWAHNASALSADLADHIDRKAGG